MRFHLNEPANKHPRLFATPVALAVLLCASTLITGCALQSTASGSSELTGQNAGTMTGTVHGGQAPIYNATVNLYAAGTTGYGAGSSLLATTTSDVNGGFQFTKLANGSTNSGASWSCPSTGPDPQIYVMSLGGNTQGTGVIATNNTAAKLMTAIGPCSQINNSTMVQVNELTTVASVFSLAQYISPGTTPGTETIGTATVQAELGLANAVKSVQNLVSISTGQVVALAYTGTSASVSGVTVTATPESAKLITLANILAACINQTSASSTVCTSLFAAATPPPAASVTSQPAATFAAATDTVQAAYYMAVNPIDAGPVASCPSASSNLVCLFNLVTGTPPFQTGLQAAPTDWTVGVTYSSTGSCTGGGSFLAAPFHAAIDASGNVWYVNGVNTNANLAEMSPTGTPLFCGGTSTYGRGVTIDPTGNVWASFENSGIQEYNAGSSGLIAWPTTNLATYSVAADKFGNIFYSATGSVNEFGNPAAATTPVASVAVGSTDSGAAFDYLATDQGGRIWVPDSGSSILAEYYPPSGDSASVAKIGIATNVLTVTVASNPFTVGDIVTFNNVGTNAYLNGVSVTITSVTATTFKASYTHANVTTANDTGTAAIVTTAGYDTSLITDSGHGYGVALDSNGYVYTVSTCCSGMQLEKFTPTSYYDNATYSLSAANLGGINGTRGLALDGAANVWIGPEFPQTTGGVYGVAEIATSGSGTSAAFTALSPTGTISGSCSSTADTCATNGGFQKTSFNEATDIEIDPSGNVWVMNTETAAVADSGTTITEIVGAAVPTMTPLSVAAANGALATKP
jgi:hypothetical protein